MFELLLTCGVLAAAVVTIRATLTQDVSSRMRMPPAWTDLPCPWCRAATSEADTSCPDCGRVFGRAETLTTP